MAKIASFHIILFFILLAFQSICAQPQGRIEISPQILTAELKKNCKEFEVGKILFFYEPEYPAELWPRESAELLM